MKRRRSPSPVREDDLPVEGQLALLQATAGSGEVVTKRHNEKRQCLMVDSTECTVVNHGRDVLREPRRLVSLMSIRRSICGTVLVIWESLGATLLVKSTTWHHEKPEMQFFYLAVGEGPQTYLYPFAVKPNDVKNSSNCWDVNILTATKRVL